MRSQAHIPLHPLRHRVLDEIHARPFEPVKSPAVILKYVFWETPEINSRDVLKTWCTSRDLAIPEELAQRASWVDGKARLVWEAHTEFTSLSWFGKPDHVPESDPFSVFGRSPPIMGLLINAVRITLLRSAGEKTDNMAALQTLPVDDFDPNSLCVSYCSNKKAIVSSDFRQDEFGLTRFTVIDAGMRSNAAGALVRRLSEIETYRTVAVLGLPEAQRAAPIITQLEQALEGIFVELNHTRTTDENQTLLNRLYRIAMDLEALTIDTRFRFAASRAYLGIVQQRFEALGEEQHMDYVSLQSFLLRRIMPAIQTCEATERRQTTLGEKIANASDLLRTQLDLDLQVQNQGLLKALNERSELQYRLQQTVEGLSIVAITYYAVSLLSYIYNGFPSLFGLTDRELVAGSVPVVILLVGIAIRRIRRSHQKTLFKSRT